MVLDYCPQCSGWRRHYETTSATHYFCTTCGHATSRALNPVDHHPEIFGHHPGKGDEEEQ